VAGFAACHVLGAGIIALPPRVCRFKKPAKQKIRKKCGNMKISLAIATVLTDQSERTLRRRIAEGALTRLGDDSGRTMISVDELKAHFCIQVNDATLHLLAQADAGNAEAQNDIGLMLMGESKAERALYWFELAAKQNYADAMHWIARCYLEGNGIVQNEDLGLMWLAKAAAYGHAISKGQLEAIKSGFMASSQT
jgi:hypothetical protein